MLGRTVIFAILVVGVLADDFQVPNRDKLKQFLVDQCKRNGAEDKISEIEDAGRTFADCLKGLVSLNVLQSEIEEAKPNGALDEVFKKYCAKAPQLKGCLGTFLDTITPCVDQESRQHLASSRNSVDQFIDFVCYKDGDRIALFIAEGGPECFREKLSSFNTCFQAVKDSIPDYETARSLSLADKCAKTDVFTACVVRALEECSNPTPGNMAESLFRFIRKGTPCHTALPRD